MVSGGNESYLDTLTSYLSDVFENTLIDIPMELYNFFSYINELPKNEYNDFPLNLDTVWILGKSFSVIHDLEDIRALIRSKIWFTYRSGFPAIGGTGPTNDKRWGCMLRCGQMIMAEALICRHLGRGWMWNPHAPDPVYATILQMFEDKKDCAYSIHQIAQMGVSEGKKIGDWFGPNTAAQVLRKLSFYDEWSSLAVHVAFDNTVIKADIRALCRSSPPPMTEPAFSGARRSIWYMECPVRQGGHNDNWHRDAAACRGGSTATWRPMLLFIPLRLGLSTLNGIYCRGLKSTFTMKQSLGIIGGKPKHALWFMGCHGNDLVYLDPHVTQPYVELNSRPFDDSTFHIPYAGSKRMPIKDIDPSLSLCFFLASERDFEDWCTQVDKVLISANKNALFELAEERPSHWPPLELTPDLNCTNCSLDYDFVDRSGTADLSDDEFEICEVVCPSVNPNRGSAGQK